MHYISISSWSICFTILSYNSTLYLLLFGDVAAFEWNFTLGPFSYHFVSLTCLMSKVKQIVLIASIISTGYVLPFPSSFKMIWTLFMLYHGTFVTENTGMPNMFFKSETKLTLMQKSSDSNQKFSTNGHRSYPTDSNGSTQPIKYVRQLFKY